MRLALILRVTQIPKEPGFINSAFGLLRLPLKSPDYSLLCKRARRLSIAIPRRLPESGSIDVVFDSSGLKIYGEGVCPYFCQMAAKRDILAQTPPTPT
jgi:hypothetical protein